jgi:predicted house-cleaning noncanonical NTP pyrophosphatase (MazG superfamily)
MTKAKVNKLLKDGKRIEKIKAEMEKMQAEIYKIQKASEWASYLDQKFHEDNRKYLGEEKFEDFGKMVELIKYADRT